MGVITVEFPKTEGIDANIASVEVKPQKVTAHNELTGRDAADQHPISAIAGLQKQLNEKQPVGSYLTDGDLQDAVNMALEQAKSGGEFDGADGYSPIVRVSEIENGHRVSVTDASGEKSFDVMNAVSEVNSIVDSAIGETIILNDSARTNLDGLTLYGKTFQEGTPSPTNPIPLVSVGDSGTVNVRVSGKNLIDLAMAAEATNVVESVDEDKTINIKGELSPQWSNKPIGTALLVKGQAYIISGVLGYGRIGMSKSATSIPGSSTEISISSNNAGNILNNRVSYCIFTALETCTAYIFYCSDNGNTGTNEVFSLQLQLEIGTEATAYEAPTVQTVTARTPNGLPGIPVANGGNFTDANGQQWVCDEIDFERGMRVQRIDRYILDGTQSVMLHSETNDEYARFNYTTLRVKTKGAYMCDRLRILSQAQGSQINTIEIHSSDGYVIVRTNVAFTVNEWNAWLAQNPVHLIVESLSVTPQNITTEEIAEYRALHTNKPITTIQNNDSAGMYISYVVDTKTYIDNKFAELEAAILSTGGNV